MWMLQDTAKKRGKQGGSNGASPLVASGSKGTGLLTVDGWLQFDMPCAIAGPMVVLRARLNEAFSAKVQQPHQPLPASLTGLPIALDLGHDMYCKGMPI